MSLKNPVTPPVIDPGTVRLVAQRLNHYATPGTTTAYYSKPINLFNPNDIYICLTAALTSRRYILNIYSTNIRTEYFKNAA